MALLFFMFNILFLPNYSANYYDYVVKLLSGVTCYWGILLDNAYILALNLMHYIDVYFDVQERKKREVVEQKDKEVQDEIDRQLEESLRLEVCI